jgi:hypothetical protein
MSSLFPYSVTTTCGQFEVMAPTVAAAMLTALYLAPHGARVISCLRGGDW